MAGLREPVVDVDLSPFDADVADREAGRLLVGLRRERLVEDVLDAGGPVLVAREREVGRLDGHLPEDDAATDDRRRLGVQVEALDREEGPGPAPLADREPLECQGEREGIEPRPFQGDGPVELGGERGGELAPDEGGDGEEAERGVEGEGADGPESETKEGEPR